jgi:hypothetical protein
MLRKRSTIFLLALLTILAAGRLLPQAPAPQPQKKAVPKKTAPAEQVMTNKDVIKLVQAGIPENIVMQKIQTSKTKFDTSVDGLLELKKGGVSDNLIAFIMNPPAAGPPPTTAPTPGPPAPAVATTPAPAVATTPTPVANPNSGAPPVNAARPVAANVTNVAATTERHAEISTAPKNFGVYIEDNGELKPLGRIQTKVQISKFRSLLKSMVPFVRQKIDINIPGAHSTSRYEVHRPNFYAFFPPSRDVSKFKLLQCKITGQAFNQRTVANASVLFSTEQNQDEVLCDIGPTAVRDLYRISPREDLPTGEFGFVEGNTGSKSTSNIDILDVYDFGVDRKEEKLSLAEYLDTLPAANVADRSFLEWAREDCQKIVQDREGKTNIVGSMMNWFKRQYSSLDVYWADQAFAKAFARLEMLQRDLKPDQAVKLANILISQDNSQNYVMVSIGGKVGSGKLIGTNEGERLMRPFDASLTNDKSKDVVPAKKMEFVGGYAGLWKVTFDQNSIKGPLFNGQGKELIFEARLNQNLDFKAKFPIESVSPGQGQTQ